MLSMVSSADSNSHRSLEGGEMRESANIRFSDRVASVSVVIPCHNCAPTLKRAFDSILLQTLRPAEVLLVDDASRDETRQLVTEIARCYPSWVTAILLDDNRGPSVARNIGWDNATQSFVAFLDADDAWHPRKLEIQYAWMEAHPTAVMSGHLCAEHRLGFEIEDLAPSVVKEFSLQHLLRSNRFSTPSVMVRRDIPERFPAEKRYSEDYHLWLSIAAAHGAVYRIEMLLAWYYKAAYGASGLSGALWRMEKGELDSIAMLHRLGKISTLAWGTTSAWSLLKFVRRVLLTGWQNIRLRTL
jgi:glycosyltransferase involved in cell wall biosynthesis